MSTDSTPTNDERLVADAILDATAAFWKNERIALAVGILDGLPLKVDSHPDGTLTVDPSTVLKGAILAGIALTQGEIPFGETQSSHLAAARQYLDGLAPYDITDVLSD